MTDLTSTEQIDDELMDEETPPVATVGAAEQRRVQNKSFEDWVRNTASGDGFKRTSVRHRNHADDSTMTIRSLMAKQESEDIINHPRDYQLELFGRAKTENLIAVLDTGTGKTLIAVLLIRWILDQESEARATGAASKVVFFLVPSVNLVLQQTAVLESNLPHSIGSFYGAMNVDIWSEDDWKKILEQHRVIVCTADILLHCLDKSFISVVQINLLIFDESHHAKKDHAYARVMRDHFMKPDTANRPKVFGMTASPVDAKADIAQGASHLERLLHSRIVTTGSLTSLQSLRRPEEINMYYTVCASVWNTRLAEDLALRTKKLPHLFEHYEMSKGIAQHLGSWCAEQCMMEVLLPRSRSKLDVAIEKDYHNSRRAEDIAHMDEIRAQYQAVLSHIETNFNTTDVQPTSDMLSDKVSVLQRLLNMEFQEVSDDRCLVFVERQITARLLAKLFNQLGNSNLRCGYLIGHGRGSIFDQTQAFKEQVLTLANFRTGELNCLFATSVAEEGLDIPLCNLVVRFDLYRTMIQYVQSRGRARQNQSKFIHMIANNNPAEQQLRQQVQIQELRMRAWCAALPEDRQLLGEDRSLPEDSIGSEKTYTEPSTGASLTHGNALGWLNHFLAVMPTKSAEPEYAVFDVQPVGLRFVAEVILPPGAPVRFATGKVSDRRLYAKQSAAFQICLKLRKLDVLDAHFMPTYTKKLPAMRNALLAVGMEKSSAYNMLSKPGIWQSGMGSIPHKLWMTFVEFPDGFEHGQEHAALIMLTKTSMPPFPPFDLVRNDGQISRVIAHTSSVPIEVNKEELSLLESFTLRIFRDIFSKTYTAKTEDFLYFLAPSISSIHKALGSSHEGIDWQLMQLIASKDCERWEPSTSTDKLLDKLFVDNWDGARKLITKSVHPTLRPQDPVPDDAAHHRWKDNILDYSVSLFKRARATAKWTADQPVIVAEKLNLRRNMLANISDKEMKEIKKAYVCPEPFRISMLPIPVAVASLAWPSVIWRFESVLIALEACDSVGISCEPSLALAAITKDTDEASDDDLQIKFHTGMGENYERLEFLGDCFLKVATTLTTFVRNPTENEFVSHVERMLLLCNKTLFNTSLALGLPKYIRSKPFSRRLWYPEGLQLLEGKGVNEEIDAYNTQKQQLSEKTIADVSEALIGAAYLTHNDPDQWRAEQWNNAVQAVYKLVGSGHDMQKWEDYYSVYKIPEYQSRASSAAQRETALMVEKLHDYRFKSPTLLQSAFTHGSQPYSFEKLPSYERLEFLGDALLDMAIINHLFYRFPDKDPQWLTEAKMAMVSNRFFGALACKLGFHKHIRHNNPAIESAIRSYTIELNDKLEQDRASKDYWQHVHSPPKCLADVVEAYVGAMFIDSGFDYGQVQRFFNAHIRWHFEDMSLYEGYVKGHPVTVLHHHLESNYGCRMAKIQSAPIPAVTRGERRELVIGVMIHNQVIAHTTGTSVRYGSVRAATSALHELRDVTTEEFRQIYECNCAGKAETVNNTMGINA